MDALLFRCSLLPDGPPDLKVCQEDWIGFYRSRGWFLLGTERSIREQRTREIEEVRLAEETRWSPSVKWRRRNRQVRRNGCNGD